MAGVVLGPNLTACLQVSKQMYNACLPENLQELRVSLHMCEHSCDAPSGLKGP